MNKQKKTNTINSYLLNNKFRNILASQPIDNIFVQSSPKEMKFKKEINIFIAPAKIKTYNNQNIFIDKNFNINYKNDKNENDIIIKQYINFLISQGVIRQEQSSDNYIINDSKINTNININLERSERSNNISPSINKDINMKKYYMIEKINDIEILKKKRFLIPQIMLQLYIENENKNKDKEKEKKKFNLKNIIKIEKKIKFEIIPAPKKSFQRQLIDCITLNDKNYSENLKFKIIDIRNNYNLNEINFSNNINRRSLGIRDNNNIDIHDNPSLSLEEKSPNSFREINKEININHNKKEITKNYIIFPKEKLLYKNSNNISFCIKSKIKKENKIQKIEQINLLRKKKHFNIKDNIINLLIYSDKPSKKTIEEENESKEEEENSNYLKDNNSNNEIDEVYTEDNEKNILRNKKKLKNKETKNRIPLIIVSNENIFIESTYDMLVIDKTWDNLCKENIINNLFIIGLNNKILTPSNINRNLNINTIYSPTNSPKKEIEINYDIDEDIKTNKSIEIQLNKNEEKIVDWNNIIIPKFINSIKIFGNKTKSKYSKNITNDIVNEIWFYIPGNENIILDMNFFTNKFKYKYNISNNYEYRFWNEDFLKYQKIKNFSFIKQKKKYIKNKIKKEISFIISTEKILSNFATPRITEPEFKIKNNINDFNAIYYNEYNNDDEDNNILKNRNINNNGRNAKLNKRNLNIQKNHTFNKTDKTTMDKTVKNNNSIKQNNNIYHENMKNHNKNNFGKKGNSISKLVYKNKDNNNEYQNIEKINKISNNHKIKTNNIIISKKNNNINKDFNDMNNKNMIVNDINKNYFSNYIKSDNNIKKDININSNVNNIIDDEKIIDKDSLKLYVLNYSINNKINNNIDYYNINEKNKNIINEISNEDIVNQKVSTSLKFNDKKNLNNSENIEIINRNYFIQKDNNINPQEDKEEIIDQNDYNYFFDNKEIMNAEKENSLIHLENKRYDEDIKGEKNEIFKVKRRRTIQRYNHLFKSKSSEKITINKIKNNNYMSKSNSEKKFELLREYSFDNNYN